jgi:hypothetical protein
MRELSDWRRTSVGEIGAGNDDIVAVIVVVFTTLVE